MQVRQRGFALVTAIFLLVVLAALGAFMVTMSTVQHTTSAQDVQGSRAYQAARAGIEWGVYQVMNPENTNPPATNPQVTPFNPQYNCANATPTAPNILALGGTLSGFTVAVACVRTIHDEGGSRISVYALTSTAMSGAAGGSSYIERQLRATVGTCRRLDNGESC